MHYFMRSLLTVAFIAMLTSCSSPQTRLPITNKGNQVIPVAQSQSVSIYMQNQMRELEQQLRPEIARGRISMKMLANNVLLVRMTGRSGFATDKTGIKLGYADTLDKIALILNRYDRSRIEIIGHTDSVGSKAYNQKLSENRAFAVMDYLINRSVSAVRLRFWGEGLAQPRAKNSTAGGRALNRRVELRIVPHYN